MKEKSSNRTGKIFLATIVGVGGLIGIWAVGTIIFSLAHVNWQVSELLRNYMVATGAIGEFQTAVDFYTHIKGFEYLIILAFLVSFPVFFKYLSTPKKVATVRR